MKTAQKLSDLIEQISSSSVTIEAYKTDGTGEIGAGFFIHPRIIVTCAHVVGITPQDINPALRSIIVTTKENQKYYASVIDFDVGLDAAILYVNIPQNTRTFFLNLGNSGTIKDGEAIVTIGSPLGYVNSVSYGIVSKSRMDENGKFFLVDLRTNPGNSGGMVFSLEKQAVVGIAAAILSSKNMSSSGITVGIGIDAVKNMLKKNKIKFVYKEQGFNE
jgi:serine protease Do